MVKQTGPLKELTKEDISRERLRLRGDLLGESAVGSPTQPLWDITGEYGTRIKNRRRDGQERNKR